jgi:hypothetical protein
MVRSPSQRPYNPKHCQQYYTPENFNDISWSWLSPCVELVRFREVYTEGERLSLSAARVAERALQITFSVLATSLHERIQGVCMYACVS